MTFTIEARVLPNGKTVLHVEGAKGEACTNLTAALVARLGQAESMEPTQAYYERDEERLRDSDRG